MESVIHAAHRRSDGGQAGLQRSKLMMMDAISDRLAVEVLANEGVVGRT